MKTSEMIGIVRLEDLPNDEIFVQLKPEFHKILEYKIRDYGIERFEKKIGSGRKIGHWLSDGSLIRFDVLIKTLEHLNLSYNGKIEYIRGREGAKIRNPKFTFDFTSCQGVRIVAGILGDGGIPTNRTNPYYTNSDINLVNGFIEDMKFVFGNLKIMKNYIHKKNTTTTTLHFPSLIQKIFLKIGLKKGKKIITNPSIPPFIFNLSKDRKYAFVSQFIDDEGSVNKIAKHISITAGTLKHYKHPNVLKDIQNILLSLKIDTSLYNTGNKPNFTGKDSFIWKIQINGQFQLKQLADNLNLRINKKRKDLKLLVESFKLRVFRRKEYLKTYLNLMKKIQEDKGYFTSLDISEGTGMAIGSCRKTLIRFKEKEFIICIKSPTSGNFHEYGKYILK